MKRDKLSHAEVTEHLHYDPETGKFTRKKTAGGVRAGATAGCIDSRGYVLIGVNGVQYQAHRLAWLYVHGHWPSDLIDHINGDTADNRLFNLREATVSQNALNRAAMKNASSGLKGVTFHKATGKWRSQYYRSGKQRHLGLFDTPEEAHEAYCNAAKREYGEFFNAGKPSEAL